MRPLYRWAWFVIIFLGIAFIGSAMEYLWGIGDYAAGWITAYAFIWALQGRVWL